MERPSKMCNLGQLDEFIQDVVLLHKRGMPVSRDMICCLLKGCIKKKDLATGRQVHSLMVNAHLDFISVLGHHLIRLFAICGSLQEANQVFGNISKPSLYAWHAIISAHGVLGESQKALELYQKMQQHDMNPNKIIYACVLKVCSSVGALGQGRLVHNQIIRSGLESDVVVGSTLIDMYAKCGSVEAARHVFDNLRTRNVVSWGVMIAGYSHCGYGLVALELFDEMQQMGVKPDRVIFLSVLKACGLIGGIAQGNQLHDQIVRSGFEFDLSIANSLIDMYAKCGILKESHKVFSNLQYRDVISWGAMIAGYEHQGHGYVALNLLEEMQQEGIKPNKVLFLCLLKACGSVGAIRQGRLIHDNIIRSGPKSETTIGNTIVDMYAKCGSLEEARSVFDKLPNRDVVSCSAIIAGYTQQGLSLPALDLFGEMVRESIEADTFIFSCILGACGGIGARELGKRLHEEIVTSGFDTDVVVGNALVDMYAKCGSLQEAYKVFDKLLYCDVVSWAAMIGGHTDCGYGFAALEFFEKMQHEGIEPNNVVFLSILKACSNLGAMSQGKVIHGQIIVSGLESQMMIGNALVDMYVKCGNLEEARNVFEQLSNRDEVSWCSMIAGYAQHGHGLAALEIFDKMQTEALKPNRVAFLCSLQACSSIGAVAQGHLMHDQIIRIGLASDAGVGNTLLDMYAKCGNSEEARKVFDGLQNQDEVTWAAMIGAYAHDGNCRLAGQLLEAMQHQGLRPNGTIYTGILTACSHAGQVEQAHHYFKSMKEVHGITPNIEHLTCIIDLLGRLGHLDEAKRLLWSMPFPPDLTVWMSLLTACRTYGNMELGRRCFNGVIHLDPNCAAAYMLMSDIYANGHMWDDVHIIQDLRSLACAWKKPGKAWIEVNDEVQEFLVGDQSQPVGAGIHAKLRTLRRLIKLDGYIPQMDVVLVAVAGQQNEIPLCKQYERLDTVLGPLTMSEKTTIGVPTTIHSCNSFTNAIKIERQNTIMSNTYYVQKLNDGFRYQWDVFNR